MSVGGRGVAGLFGSVAGPGRDLAPPLAYVFAGLSMADGYLQCGPCCTPSASSTKPSAGPWSATSPSTTTPVITSGQVCCCCTRAQDKTTASGVVPIGSPSTVTWCSLLTPSAAAARTRSSPLRHARRARRGPGGDPPTGGGRLRRAGGATGSRLRSSRRGRVLFRWPADAMWRICIRRVTGWSRRGAPAGGRYPDRPATNGRIDVIWRRCAARTASVSSPAVDGGS